jgi:hypothetical protein
MRPLHSVNKQIEIANITKKKSPENANTVDKAILYPILYTPFLISLSRKR